MSDYLSHHSELLPAQRGQSLVEFALTLPLLLLILVGVLDLAQAYRGYVALTNAAREAARFAASHPIDTAGIQAHGAQELPADLSSATFTIECAQFGSTSFSSAFCSDAGRADGDQVRVTVGADFQLLALYLFRIPSVRLSNYAVMAIMGT